MPISQEEREQIEERLAWFKRKQPPDYDEIYDLVDAVPVLLAALDDSDDSLKILRPVLEQYRQVVEEIHSKGRSQAIMDLKKERDRLEKVATELGSDSALLRVENERIREENTRLASQQGSDKEWYSKFQAADAHVAEAHDAKRKAEGSELRALADLDEARAKVERLERERGAEAEALRVAFELLADKNEITGEDIMDVLERIDAGEALAYLEGRGKRLATAEARVKELEVRLERVREWCEEWGHEGDPAHGHYNIVDAVADVRHAIAATEEDDGYFRVPADGDGSVDRKLDKMKADAAGYTRRFDEKDKKAAENALGRGGRGNCEGCMTQDDDQ